MKNIQIALAVLIATGVAATPFAAQAKHHTRHHHSSMVKKNDKKNDAANPSSQGNVGPGTNQAGSKNNGTK
jgi:hypothetical protein